MSPGNGMSVAAAIPVDPDAPEARRWLSDELAKPIYQTSKPNWFDQLAKAFWDWLGSLFSGTGGVLGDLLPLVGAVVVTLVVVAAVVVAILLFGPPRLRRRAAGSGDVFGDDERSAAQLRAAAEASAASGDFSTAIIERFRAIARDAAERTVAVVLPGTTADDVARQLAAAFPDLATELTSAAREFDGVRYLDRAGTADGYRRLTELDERLRSSRPASFAGAAS